MSRLGQIAILALGFVLGVCLMGVEMAGIRIMTPYFGSGIQIWAAMISTVMLALMAGYYIGGMVADRAPSSRVLGGAILTAGALVFLAPFIATPVLDWTMENVGYEAGPALLAAVIIMFAPMTLMSFFSPFAVRLLLADAQHGGRVAGSVYSITTVGNIVGTLGTALVLMRYLGNRDIMFSFGGVIIACGFALFLLNARARVAAD